MPKIIQEGLKSYCVCSADYAEYFYSVEYRTIRANRISSLLPVQVREKDNQSEIYYDVTGKRSLEACAEEHAFSISQCKNMIRELIRMMKELEDYLLEPDFISFEPAFVFTNGRKLFWLYGIPHEGSVQEALENFFSFLLAKVDYDDQEAVHFVYQIFWIVRKQGFSREVVEDYLENGSGEEGHKEEADSERYGGFLFRHPSELLSEDRGQKGEEIAREYGEDCQEAREESEDFQWRAHVPDHNLHSKEALSSLALTGFLAVLFAASFIGAGILAYYGWAKGLTQAGIFLLAACLIASFLAAFLLVHRLIHRIRGKDRVLESEDWSSEDWDGRNRDERNQESYDWKGNDWKGNGWEGSAWGGKDRQERGPEGRDWRAKDGEGIDRQVKELEAKVRNEDDFPLSGEKDGTVILSKIKRNCPVLRSLEDGSLTLVRDLPFYIGSDPVLNQMVLIDKTISRQHAVILQGKKNTWRIKDLGSTNGTWIQGRPVHSDLPDLLEEGVIISFAQKKYRFMINRDTL